MAVTGVVTQVLRGLGAEDYKQAKVSGDASYPTGGYAVPPSAFQFNAFATDGLGTGLPPVLGYYQVIADLQGANYAVINPANGNLQFFVQTTGVEVANAVNVSTVSTLLGAFGH
jgi:hypothetical protein